MLRKLSISIFYVITCLWFQAINAMDCNRDQFNFLSNKYPHLLEKAKEPFTHCFEETKHYQKLKSLIEQTEESPEILLIGETKKLMSMTTLHWFGETYEKFVLDQMSPGIDALAQNHPKHGYYTNFFHKALTNHTILENILLASEYIFQFVKDEGGGTVLFLGRTPCMVQVAYEELLKVEKDSSQSLAHINFSGHPDALTKRESSFFRSDTNIARDIVTFEKLSHYFNYLDTKNILKAKKLFIVDIIGSGSSLNSFLRIINSYYQNRLTDIPELSFLNLTQDMNWLIDKSEYYTFEKIGKVSNRGILTLPADGNRNMKKFQISACGVPIFDKVLTDILDMDMFQEFVVHGIQYPAQRWTSEFDSQRDEGGKYHTELYKYLRPSFLDLILSHTNIENF